MKHLRKIMPLLLSFSLGVGTMTPAFAADVNPDTANDGSTAATNNQAVANGALTVDPKITVTGFKNGDEVIYLPCLHVFHKNCLLEWFRRHDDCPICKFKLTGENLNP